MSQFVACRSAHKKRKDLKNTIISEVTLFVFLSLSSKQLRVADMVPSCPHFYPHNKPGTRLGWERLEWLTQNCWANYMAFLGHAQERAIDQWQSTSSRAEGPRFNLQQRERDRCLSETLKNCYQSTLSKQNLRDQWFMFLYNWMGVWNLRVQS